MGTTVYKQLATMQDLTPGYGKVMQQRNGVDIELDKIGLGFTVPTVADLRDINGAFQNQSAILLGYSEPLDGGGGPIRVWDEGQIPGFYTDNGGSIIVPGDGSAAWLMDDNIEIDVRLFGAKGDIDTFDDTPSFVLADAYCLANGLNLHIPAGKIFYLVNFECHVNITGTGKLCKLPAAAGSGVVISLYGEDLRATDISVNGNLQHNGIAIAAGSHRSQLINVKVEETQGSGLSCRGSNDCIITLCTQKDANGQFGDAIYVDTSERTKVILNNAYDFTRDGIVFETGCKDSTASFNTLRNGHDSTDGYNAGVWCELGTGAIITDNIIDNMGIGAINTGIGVNVATDGTSSVFEIERNMITGCPISVQLGGSNLNTHHKVSANSFDDFEIGVLCGSGNTIDISRNHFKSTTITDVDDGLIVFNNTLANQTVELKISGNTKETNIYTADNSADIRFIAAFNRLAKLTISDSKGSWRINSGPINAIEEATISNSDLVFNVVDDVNYTFPTIRSILNMSNTQIIMASNMTFGKGLLSSKIVNSDFAGSGVLTLSDSSTATNIIFNGVSIASSIDIVSAYNSSGKEYWDGFFTIRKKIDCSIATPTRTISLGGVDWKLNVIKSQIRVDDSMVGVTGDYLSLSHGSTVDYGSTAAAAAAVFAKNNKGNWVNYDGSLAPQLVAGDSLYLVSTLADTQSSTIVGGGNFGGIAGDLVTVVIQGHLVDALPNI